MITSPIRRLTPPSPPLRTWADVQPHYQQLLGAPLATPADLRQWLDRRRGLDDGVAEDFARRYVRANGNAHNPAYARALNHFVTDIQPKVSHWANVLNAKLLTCTCLEEMMAHGTDIGLAVLVRDARRAVALYREASLPTQASIRTDVRQYGARVAAMTVALSGEVLTLSQATNRLRTPDRAAREATWRAIQARRQRDHAALHALLDRLVASRHHLSQQAGFANYRDYAFAALGRFDYTPADCAVFHQAVARAVVPLLTNLAHARRIALNVPTLRPWDWPADPTGQPPLVPFDTPDELAEKTIACLARLHPQLGAGLATVRAAGHLDLAARPGKAPGAFTYPLDATGVPYLSTVATGTLADVVTLLHESGHALHNLLSHNLPTTALRHPPAEVTELAATALELLTMDHWDVFFDNPADLRRAKVQHLQRVIETLPWVAAIDQFQHWLYEHPAHTAPQRTRAWGDTANTFADQLTDWADLEPFRDGQWQQQRHLFEAPFYYLEYGLAQLGAIALWKNYRQNPARALEGYLAMLRLGYAVPLRQLYQAANVPFDFSEALISELMNFVRDQLNAMKSISG